MLMSAWLTSAFDFWWGVINAPPLDLNLDFLVTAAPNQGGGFAFDGVVFHDPIAFVELTMLCVLCKGSPESGRPLFTPRPFAFGRLRRVSRRGLFMWRDDSSRHDERIFHRLPPAPKQCGWMFACDRPPRVSRGSLLTERFVPSAWLRGRWINSPCMIPRLPKRYLSRWFAGSAVPWDGVTFRYPVYSIYYSQLLMMPCFRAPSFRSVHFGAVDKPLLSEVKQHLKSETTVIFPCQGNKKGYSHSLYKSF